MLTIEEGFGNRVVTVEVAGEEVSFTVAREDFAAVMAAYQWARQNGFWELKAADNGQEGKTTLDPMVGVAIANYQVIACIRSWKGVSLPSGEPAPCTNEAKLRLFGKYPEALPKIMRELERQEEEERKNLPTSQAGSPGTSRQPARPAESSTETPEPAATDASSEGQSS